MNFRQLKDNRCFGNVKTKTNLNFSNVTRIPQRKLDYGKKRTISEQLADTSQPIDVVELRKFIRRSKYLINVDKQKDFIPFQKADKSLNMKSNTFDWMNIKYGI